MLLVLLRTIEVLNRALCIVEYAQRSDATADIRCKTLGECIVQHNLRMHTQSKSGDTVK